MRIFVLFVFFQCIVALSFAQVMPDSTVEPAGKGPKQKIKREHFSTLHILVPTAMIGYGIASLHTNAGKNVNEQVYEEVWQEHPHGSTTADNYLQWVPAVAVYGLDLAGIKAKHNFIDRTVIYAISMSMVTATTQIAKNVSGEWRPDHSANNSFPSGHTATAFASAEFLRLEYKDHSPWYGVAGYAVAVTTGYLRLYNNKHWFGDVVAGAGVGILSTDFAYYVYPWLKKTFTPASRKTTVNTGVFYPVYAQGALGIGYVKRW
jgi:hypothetical protein